MLLGATVDAWVTGEWTELEIKSFNLIKKTLKFIYLFIFSIPVETEAIKP